MKKAINARQFCIDRINHYQGWRLNDVDDPQDRLLQTLTHTGPGSTAISSYGYSYDAAGSITNWTQSQAGNTVLPVSAWNLRQDGSEQLTGVSITSRPYSDNAWGKRESLEGADVASLGYAGYYTNGDRVSLW